MPKNKIILFCFLFSWIGLHPIAAISLEKTAIEQKILQAIQGKNATVGAAFSSMGNYLRLTTTSVSANECF